jgi:hypothetical protein
VGDCQHLAFRIVAVAVTPGKSIHAQRGTTIGMPSCTRGMYLVSRISWITIRLGKKCVNDILSRYMPKDSPSPGLGHRHDWEGIVVWIDNPEASTQSVLAVSTSAHGEFDTFIGSDAPLDGFRPKIEYFSNWPINHQLGVSATKGGEQPLIAWESMTEAARTALSNTDFGSATVPFKDSTFVGNLAKASY